MGLFGKIKNILFEDDDEVEEMPVYTKEDGTDTPRRINDDIELEKVVEEPIKASDNSRFKNVKRDIDLNYDEKDVLGEIPDIVEAVKEKKEEEQIQIPLKKEEKKSIFPSFDEDEFERLNSRITKNENKVKNNVQSRQSTNFNQSVVNEARKANNNFSSTSTNRETRIENSDRYKINSSTQMSKKTFTPSPIISPVYGILDKNYRKDDIVDKKGGMKREKVVKPIVKQDELVTIEEMEQKVVEVNIDSVRKKAYGELENLIKVDIPKEKIEIKKDEELIKKKVPVVHEEVAPKVSVVEPVEVKVKTPTVEEQLDEKFNVDDIEIAKENELDKVVEDVISSKNEVKKVNKPETTTKTNPKILDDLEKTSTLQILDDIEKELNSIKPISKSVGVIEDDEEDNVTKDDTLEKDLFNLIDSMYEEGEEEEDA